MIETYQLPEVVHYFVIKVYTKRGGNLIEYHIWSDMKWQLRVRYQWYFNYRAALLQVKYPRYIVEVISGNEPAKGKALEQIKEDKRRAKKAKITQYKNKLQKARQNWTSLFPIEEDELYQKAVQKINRLELELNNI
jgi:hypothetical protein